MLRSLLRVAGDHVRIQIHDDGSLTPQSIETTLLRFPGIRIVSRAEAVDRLMPLIARYPRLKAWWPTTHWGIKWLDVYLLGDTRDMILLDSDALFFKRPDLLLESGGKTLWMKDSNYMLDLPPEAGPKLFVARRLPQLNSGVGRVDRSRFDLNIAERLLEIVGKPRDDQTLHAIIAARDPDSMLLPPQYDCAIERGLRDVVCKHYTNPFRFMYFEEGIPRAAKLLGLKLAPWLQERP